MLVIVVECCLYDWYFFEVWIGIYIGFLVVGIVGIKKFVYDIWGDMVNIVFCMEINGIAGCVNFFVDIYEFVKEIFCCIYYGNY